MSILFDQPDHFYLLYIQLIGRRTHILNSDYFEKATTYWVESRRSIILAHKGYFFQKTMRSQEHRILFFFTS